MPKDLFNTACFACFALVAACRMNYPAPMLLRSVFLLSFVARALWAAGERSPTHQALTVLPSCPTTMTRGRDLPMINGTSDVDETDRRIPRLEDPVTRQLRPIRRGDRVLIQLGFTSLTFAQGRVLGFAESTQPPGELVIGLISGIYNFDLQRVLASNVGPRSQIYGELSDADWQRFEEQIHFAVGRPGAKERRRVRYGDKVSFRTRRLHLGYVAFVSFEAESVTGHRIKFLELAHHEYLRYGSKTWDEEIFGPEIDPATAYIIEEGPAPYTADFLAEAQRFLPRIPEIGQLVAPETPTLSP